MTATIPVQDVAAALLARLSGASTAKLHALLYYCQGHHLAHFEQPLFDEELIAVDTGPHVTNLPHEITPSRVPAGLGEAELNTIGYVASRYGNLSARDLQNLTRGEKPWQRANRARKPGSLPRIGLAWITEHFMAANQADWEEEGIDINPVVHRVAARPTKQKRLLDDVRSLLASGTRAEAALIEEGPIP